jgi:hypothetical protein
VAQPAAPFGTQLAGSVSRGRAASRRLAPTAFSVAAIAATAAALLLYFALR